MQILSKAFSEKYPGVEVDFFRAGLSQVMERFSTESAAGRHSADVVDLVVRRAKEAHSKGLVTPYTPPALANYPAEMQVEGGIYVPYALHLGSFAWNTDLVSAEDAPKTWEDLLDPKWRGKLAMQDPMQGGGAAAWVITMYDAWGEERWTDFMTRLAAQKPDYGGYLQVREMVVSGEAAIQVAAYPNFTEPLAMKGAPIDWGTPQPTMRTYFTLNLSKNAPHPNAGKLFINFMLSDEAQQVLADNSMLPALESAWPEPYRKLQGTKYVPQARLESTKPEWFKEKIREFFADR
jgi:iron(III) transport system substrate-binding protein